MCDSGRFFDKFEVSDYLRQENSVSFKLESQNSEIRLSTLLPSGSGILFVGFIGPSKIYFSNGFEVTESNTLEIPT